MISSGDKDLSKKIRDFAASTGFDLIGIAPSKQLNEQKEILNKWLSEGMNAGMQFISRNIDKRTNPALLLNGAKSVIVAGINYYPSEMQGSNGIPVISKYAYGKDYHIVVSEKLNRLLDYIISCEPIASGKVCVGSAPILEKAWAKEAGLGWIGKNSILINKERGSFLFLGELVVDIDLQYDIPFSEDFCGNCRLCLDSCPTKAINENKTIDVRRCISWLTVENKNPIPEEFRVEMKDRIFGCDICQDVCPWNKNAKPHSNSEFNLSEELKQMTSEGWANLTREKFDRLFDRSAIKRRTYERFMENVTNVTNSGN
jgi:epoxyqueuosine reductase